MTVSVAYRLPSKQDPGVVGDPLTLTGYPTEVVAGNPPVRKRLSNPRALDRHLKVGES